MITKRELLISSLALMGSSVGGRLISRAGPKVVRSIGDLEAACRAGGSYVVLPGIYVLGDKVLKPVSGTHLKGTPGRTILQKRTSPGPYRTRAFFDIEDGKDITIEGLVFDHHAARTEHAVIVRASRPGSSTRLNLLNNIYRQCHVHLERFVHDVMIRNGRFLGDNVAMTGVAMGGEISRVDGKGLNTNGAVRNVTLENLYFEAIQSEAIDINWHAQNIILRRIRAYNCDLGGEDEVIDIGGDIHTTRANECRNILLEDVAILNDRPSRSSSLGIHVKGSSRNITLRNVRIVRRKGSGKTAGVRIWNAIGTRVDGLLVDGCTYGLVTVGGRTEATVLSDLQIRNYAADAIQLEGTEASLDGFEIEGLQSKGLGLDLAVTDNAVIRNGRIRTRASVGLRSQSANFRIVIEDVTVNGASSGRGFDIRSKLRSSSGK